MLGREGRAGGCVDEEVVAVSRALEAKGDGDVSVVAINSSVFFVSQRILTCGDDDYLLQYHRRLAPTVWEESQKSS